MKSKGIVKAHGVSVHSLDAMKAAVKSPWVDVIHVRINPYGIAMDKPEPKEVVKVIKQLHDSGKGVIGMKVIGDGKYSGDSEKIDNTLRFVMGLGTVNMMIVGFENTAQIDLNMPDVKGQLCLLFLHRRSHGYDFRLVKGYLHLHQQNCSHLIVPGGYLADQDGLSILFPESLPFRRMESIK